MTTQTPRLSPAHALALALAVTLGAAASPLPAPAQFAPPTAGGTPALDHLLQRLAEPRRVLMIAAHPDDEDTAVLTYATHALGAEAAYLSLNRGEGGQNAIGDELGVSLGLIRSRELQAARGIDGARQFFTRASDFGYSRSLEETERYWSEERILEDVVRVVRRFRPHVIVSIFSGTSADGHGHHQMAGVLAHRAWEVAGDPAIFPELAEEGLEPWTPRKLYRSTRFDSGATTLSLPVGRLDPRTGRTYFQIAMESRSQHLSQGFGTIQPTGPRSTSLALADSRVPGPDTSLFAGIPRGDARLVRVADSLRAVLPTARPNAALPALLDLARRDAVEDEVRANVLSRAVLTSAGVVVDAIASAAEVVPGDEVTVDITVYNGGPQPVTLESLDLLTTEGWEAGEEMRSPVVVPPDSVLSHRLTARVDAGARPTQPYFLERPPQGGVYDWSDTPPGIRGEPFAPPPLRVVAGVRIDDASVEVVREAVHRRSEPTAGEIRRPLRVIPRLEIRLAPDRLVWSSADGQPARTFSVELEHNGTDPLRGEVALEIEGWTPPPAQPFALERTGETSTLRFEVTRPSGWDTGDTVIRAVARTAGGGVYREAVEIVAYPHIRDTPRVVEAEAEVRVAPVVLPDLDDVGYVRGVADRVPDALISLGLPLTILDDETLARGDLSRFGAIVIGPRAYEAEAGPARYNDRLLAYVRGGGHLVVQYQQYGFAQGAYAPYPLTIARPHDRITDPEAPVQILAPDHPVFQRPHAIGPEDWEGWPQERGLYFAGTWDDLYEPLVEMADPGLAPVRGGLLVASHGDGTYVYTGLSFFRALPAAVPGPTRLFLNLLALGQEAAGP